MLSLYSRSLLGPLIFIVILLVEVHLVVVVLDFRLGRHAVLHLQLRGLNYLMLRILTLSSIALASKSVPPLFFHPVKVVVVFEAFTVEQVLEYGSQDIVVWPLFKT